MLEFFRGWKRKVGCVTLGVFLTGWMRSRIYQDTIKIASSSLCEILLVSAAGHLVIAKFDFVLTSDRITKPLALWTSLPLSNSGGWIYWNANNHRMHFGVHNRSFLVHREMFNWGNDQISCGYVHAPYWSIVLPLTAISAWLLLSKSRPKINAPITPASESA